MKEEPMRTIGQLREKENRFVSWRVLIDFQFSLLSQFSNEWR